jgi:ribosomal RNA-processing protein 12
MADCFLKVRAHTESNPVYIKANLLLKALDQSLSGKSLSLYYAAILDMATMPEELVQQEASVLLLACVLQSVPISLIQKEFFIIKSSIISLIRKDSTTLSKYSIKILERLLQVVTKPEWEEWGEKTKVLTVLVELVLDSNETSRLQASSSLVKLLRKGLNEVPKVIEYISSTFEELLDMQKKHVKAETLVNALGFLGSYLQLIPLKEVYSLTDKILSLCMLNMSLQVTTRAYLVLETLFAGLLLPRNVIALYLTNLLSAPVMSGGNEELQIAYIQALTQAVTYFNKADSIECYKILGQGISTISEFLLSNQFNVQHASCSGLKNIIIRCITPSHVIELDPAEDLALSFDVLNIEDRGIKTLQKINAIMVYLLNDRFYDILEIIFPVIGIYVQQLGSKSGHVLQRIIIELDTIALKWHNNEKFQKLLGVIINTLGCKEFFGVLPLRPHLIALESENFLEHSRSWLLQIVANYFHAGDLLYFFDEIYKILESLEKIKVDYLKQGLITSGSKYQILIEQLWAAFPSFCSVPNWNIQQQTVLNQKLPLLSKLISQNNAIKQHITLGLKKCMKTCNFHVFQQSEEKFLPILFNNYLASPDKSILLLLKDYPATPQYAEKLCKKLIQKVLEAKQNNKGQEAHLLMDILVRVCGKLHNIDQADKEILSRFISAYIESPDGKLQKKAYRILRSLYIVDVKLVENLITNGEIKVCTEVARKERLKVYHLLIKGYSADKVLVMLNKYLLEIIHCLKSQSHKTRELCKAYIIDIGAQLHHSGLFMNLWNSLLAGLASSIDSTKSTTVDLLRILTKSFAYNQPISMFANELEQDNCLYNISTIIILLLKDPSKEVVKSALKFLKAVVPILTQTTANSISESILQGIFYNKEEISSSLKNHFKYVINKLLKKSGYEFIDRIFPAEHKKLLSYVYKESKKKSKKKSEPKQEKDQDDFDMNLDAQIKENPQEKVNFPREYHFLNPLDLPATNKIKKTNKKKDEYPIQDDKFIINEDDGSESDLDTPVKKRKINENSSEAKHQKKNQSKSLSFVQYSQDVIKKKATKTNPKVNKIISKAKQGVLKGLKARKKKFSV